MVVLLFSLAYGGLTWFWVITMFAFWLFWFVLVWGVWWVICGCVYFGFAVVWLLLAGLLFVCALDGCDWCWFSLGLMFYYALGAAFLGFGSYCGALLLVLCLSVFGVFCLFVVFCVVGLQVAVLCGWFVTLVWLRLFVWYGIVVGLRVCLPLVIT